jgi:CO/xanthine dehydrogenase FAD-binding subunit
MKGFNMVTFYRRLPKFDYISPHSMNEAFSLLTTHKGKTKIIAGGTDVIPKLKRREQKTPEYILDLKGIPNLDYIRYNNDVLTIGALTTIHAVETSATIRENFDILLQAAGSMASAQIRNRGTIVGNICNAAPSADMAPALLTLGAKLKLIGEKGEKIVPIEDFFTGPGQTVLSDGEIVQEIQVPKMPDKSRALYIKLEPRHSMDLAVVGVAVLVILNGDTCQDIKIGLGAVSPTPMRAKKAENTLKGQKLNTGIIEKASQTASEESQPIDDQRASAEYRRDMVKVLTMRAINMLRAG